MTEVTELKSPTQEDRDFIGFFCAATHDNLDYMETTLNSYDIGEYLITAETALNAHIKTNGEHFHFLVEMRLKDYHRFSKRVFKDKFNLKGRAADAIGRQYGRIKKDIRDLDKLKAYMCKEADKEMMRTNMTEDMLDSYINDSFVKDDKKTFQQELFVKLDELKLQEWTTKEYGVGDDIIWINAQRNYSVLGKAVIRFCIENDKNTPAASTIQKYIKDWTAKCLPLPWEDRANLVFIMSNIRNPFDR